MINGIKDIRWLIKRFQAMSFAEITYRSKIEWKKNLWKILNPSHLPESVNVDPRKDNFEDLQLNKAGITSREINELLSEAGAYLRHEWLFFGLKNIQEDHIDWHCDPVSGISSPMQYGFDINYRDEQVTGNVKNTWEKNRHQHLTTLAVAYSVTGDEKYADEVVNQLNTWLEQNPYLTGLNWTQALELGIRLISWVWCERLLRKSKHYGRIFSPDSNFWVSVYRHQKFIKEHYSQGSSANNHLIGEMAGLFIASTVWPYFKESAAWRTLSFSVLEKEIVKQNFPSGINREQAFSYQVFDAEFLLLCLIEDTRHFKLFSDTYRDYVSNMITVIPALTDYGENLPRYGDEDDGRAIKLQPIGSSRTEWIFQIGQNLLDADVPVNGVPQLSSTILGYPCGGKNTVRPERYPKAFKDAGIYLLTRKRGTPDEIFILADAGPLGYLSIAAHGHADALSFTMSVGGIPIIVDPGTYCYHTDKYWRSYFRGTKAHSTLTVNGEDQSVQDGPFLWSRKAKSKVTEWDPVNNKLKAEHDGYTHRGVVHERLFRLNNNSLYISDNMKGDGSHILESRLHFAPGCEVKLTGQICHVKKDNIRIQINVDNKLKTGLLYASDQGGWFSPRFAVKEPSYTLVMNNTMPIPVVLETKMKIDIT